MEDREMKRKKDLLTGVETDEILDSCMIQANDRNKRLPEFSLEYERSRETGSVLL